MHQADSITRRFVAIAMCLTIGGWIGAVQPSTAATSDALPPVTLNSTTFHEGDTITMSGTGCIDPETGTGTGLVVVLERPADGGRSGTIFIPTVTAIVNADGTFSGSGVVTQPLYPEGSRPASILCQRPNQPPDHTVISGRGVQVEVVAPALPDFTVPAGGTFDYVMPCTIEGAAYGGFSFELTVPGRDDIFFGVEGTYPQATSPHKGDHVKITVPAEATPGTYAASASCSISESGIQAYFNHFSVTIAPPEPLTPGSTSTSQPAAAAATTSPPATAPGEAPGATAVPGSPAFTG